MENFWTEHAAALIAECGSDFIRTATLEQVVDHAGADFKDMSYNTRSGVLATARSMLAKVEETSTEKA